jgi:hypothetical protein
MKALPKILLALTCVAALSLAYPASVQAVPTTYRYTGNHFTRVFGPDYTTSMYLTVMVTLSGPLAPNMPLTAVTPLAFTLSDGVHTMTNHTVNSAFFVLATGPTGQISGWAMDVFGPFEFEGVHYNARILTDNTMQFVTDRQCAQRLPPTRRTLTLLEFFVYFGEGVRSKL